MIRLGPPATFSFVAMDINGDAWVTAADNNTVGVVSSSGLLINTYSVGYNPGGIAIDNSGNAWVAKPNSSVTEISSLGGITSYPVNNDLFLWGIAIDGAGNAWATVYSNIDNANSEGTSIVELSGSGSILSPTFGYTGGKMNGPRGIAIDGSGDAWVTNLIDANITELIGIATPVVTPLAVGVKNHQLGERP